MGGKIEALKTIRKILKAFLWALSGVVILILLAVALLYVPPVQRFVLDRAARIVENSTGMRFRAERFRLGIPLRIGIDGASLATPAGDTLATVGQLRADIALWPLLAGEIRSPRISLENVSATYRDTVSAINLGVRAARLDVRGAALKLNDNSVRVSRVALGGVDTRLDMGESRRTAAEQTDTTSQAAWSFLVRRLELDSIKFGMRTEPGAAELAVDLPLGTLRRVSVDLGRRDISAAGIRLVRGGYSYMTGGAAASNPRAAAKPDAIADTLPWTVGVGSIELVENRAAYGSRAGRPAEGFDPRHIRAEGIGLLAENILYRGGDISAGLRRLELSERSGLRITQGRGDFSMADGGISLGNFTLATPRSEIGGSVDADPGIMEMSPSTRFQANISASISPGDIFIFVPVDAALKRALAGRTLTLDGDFSGTAADISINRLAAAVPGHVRLDARGDIRSANNPANLGGRISFRGSLRNTEFLKGFIADTALRRRIGFPAAMTFGGEASFSPGVYELSRFRLGAGGGRLEAGARVDARGGGYSAAIRMDDFPLYAFLSSDSLGLASLTLDVRGRGFDPVKDMDAGFALSVDRFDRKGYDFGGISADASIAGGRIGGHIDSRSSALVFTMGIEGSAAPGNYEAHLTGDVGKADFYGMKLSSDALALTTIVDMHASVSADSAGMRYALGAVFDSTILHHGDNTERIGRTTLKASSGRSLTSAQIRSGDLKVDFLSPLALDSLTSKFGAVASELSGQIGRRSLGMNSLRRALPELKLTASAQRNNALREMARTNGIDFRRFSVDIDTSGDSPLRAGIEVDGLHSGTLALDTLNLWARQKGDSLRYALRLANRPGNTENLALIYVYGSASDNRASLNVLQRNRADSVGFRFGLEARLLDSAVRATFTPASPVLGYEQWSVNGDNYAEYRFDGSLYADLRLEGPHGSHVILESAAMDNIPAGALRLDMAGIDISHLVELFPTAPRLGGIASSDIRFGFHEGLIAAQGGFGVKDFMYGRRRVADVDARVDFRSAATGLMSLDAYLGLDSKPALTATGTYLTGGEGEMDLTVGIPGIPLAAANAFLPAGTASLDGMLDGKFSLQGAPSAIRINGDAGFSGGSAAIEITGTSFGISEERITVADDIVKFNGFGFIAPNGRKLGIDGSLDIRNFGAVRADIALKTNDFQAVSSARTGGSQINGTAALDMDVTARGAVNALAVRGNVNLRSNTDITYILRSQPEKISDRRQDIVTFMVFADSLFMETYAPVENLRPASNVDMLVGVNIEDGLQASLFLDEQGENRIELRGRGALSFSMNPQGDMRLSGRYTLSGGTVYYKPPIIPSKIFAVQDGSHVEWTGDIADPSFSIKAVQTMQVDVTFGGATNRETFEITIAFSGSLQQMSVTFDLACPTNPGLQNGLLAMAPEQRMQQALSLLLHGQYTGPGATTRSSTLDARDQLNNFISREVNQWARNNLRGVDFSVGIDTRSDESGTQHTDYSYSVSKRLFSDRVRVTVGGRISDNATSQTFSDNLVDDISLEYRLTRRDNMFLRVYRLNTRRTIFEGEFTETGAGFLMRKKMNRPGDLFRLESNRERREARRVEREERSLLRARERAAASAGETGGEDTGAAEEKPEDTGKQ